MRADEGAGLRQSFACSVALESAAVFGGGACGRRGAGGMVKEGTVTGPENPRGTGPGLGGLVMLYEDREGSRDVKFFLRTLHFIAITILLMLTKWFYPEHNQR